MASRVTTGQAAVPLCVDLDGTLLKTDMMWESLLRLLRRNPFYAFLLLAWWFKGRAFLKQEIARRVDVDVSHLPLCETFCEYLRIERSNRPLILVTASDQRIADKVAARVGFFSEVMASDGKVNLRGPAKAEALDRKFGPKGFDYAGNSHVDYPVWQAARHAVVVNARRSVASRAGEISRVSGVFQPLPPMGAALFRSLRPHQWVKNLIVFVPVLTAHKLGELHVLAKAFAAFVLFSICASAVYWINDLADLDADRQHPTRKQRPFAAGDLPLWVGLAGAPILIMGALLASASLTWSLAAVLASYILITTLYSWILKEIVLLDVFCLASLYTLRLAAGHEAGGIKYSAWLLVFSMFLFLSLALVKRYVEIADARKRQRDHITRRGYRSGDADLVSMVGIGCGLLAVLVLALYVNSPQVLELYRRPLLLLLLCPLLLYWIGRVWLLAHRNAMHDDPIVFALRDLPSYCTGALTLGILWAATR